MKSKLIIIATAVILIITVLLLFYLHSISEKEVVRRFKVEQLAASRQLAKEIESYLHDRSRGVEVLSAFSALQYRNMNEIAATMKEYFEYLKKDHVKAISVYDEKGTIIYSTTKDAIGRSYAECDFFHWAVKKENKGKQFVSSLIRRTDDATTPPLYSHFLIAAPIYNDAKDSRHPKPTHKFAGVVTLTIDLEEILAAFLPIASPYTGKEKVWVTDKDGTLLFQPEHPEMALKNFRSQDKTCFKCHISFDHVETILNEKQGTTEYQLKDKPKKLASYSSIEFKNISWKIVLDIPFEEVSGFINNNLYLTFILIGIITVSLVGGSSFIFRGYRLKAHAEAEMKQLRQRQVLEDKIVESGERYRTLVESSPDAIAVHCEGKIVFVNSACVKLVGAANTDELIGSPAIEVVHPDDRELALRRITEILETGKPNLMDEARFLRRDGSVIDAEVVTIPTTYKNKPAVQVIVRDITERKRVEEALLENEKRLREAQHLAHIGNWELDLRNNRLKWSDEIYHIFELQTGSFGATYEAFLDVIHPDDREFVNQAYTNSVTNRKGCSIDHRLLTKDGSIKYVHEQCETYYDEKGNPVRSIGTVQDITERKRAEERVLKLNRVYALLSNINQVIVRVHDVNQLFNDICRIAIEDGKFRMAWIGMVNTDSEKVEVVSSAGFTSDYLAKINIDLNDEKRSQGPTGKTIISGSHFISNDIEHDENMIPWREDALKLGYRSSASFPIKVFGNMRGAFNMYSSEAGFFDKDEIKLLDELAMDISFALEFIEREAQRKRADEALQDERCMFIGGPTVVFRWIAKEGWPVEYVSPNVLNQFGYTVEDFTSSRILFADIVHPNDLERVAGEVRKYCESGVPSFEQEYRIIRTDGEYRWLYDFTVVRKDDYGNITHFQGYVHDITERKKAEEAFRKSEEQLELFFTQSLAGFFFMMLDEPISWDKAEDKEKAFDYMITHQRITKVNDAMLAQYRAAREQFIGLTLADFFAHDIEQGRQVLRQLFDTGHLHVETDERRFDGTQMWSEGDYICLYDANRCITGQFGVQRDITERKLAEEAILKLSYQNKLILNSLGEGVYGLDSSGKTIFINPAAATMLGCTVEELIGKSMHEIMHHTKADGTPYSCEECLIYAAFKNGIEHRVVDEVFWKKDGTSFPVEYVSTPIQEHGVWIGTVVVFKDITERKRAEQEIISQKNRFAQLFENSPIAIALLDDQDKIVHINESFSALFGYYIEEVKGKSIDDLVVPPEFAEEAKSYSEQNRAGDQINKEGYRKKKDGTLVFVNVIGIPIIINEKIVGIYSMYVDLTQRKDAEDKMRMAKELAEQSDKLKSEFLAQMSHEIRTPLNAIVGNVDYLNQSFGKNMVTEASDCFDGIDLASKRIIRTVDLILNVAELQTSGYNPQFVKIDLNSEILNKLYLEHQLSAKQKRLELIYTCKSKDSKVLADVYSVTQIFANLIDNAIKYTKKGKVEILLTKNKDGNVVVEVKDTGIGMSKEFLPRIFEPFLQEDQGFTRSYDGSGLGLALVKNYCEINNAVLEVESEKNVGTTFRVIFRS